MNGTDGRGSGYFCFPSRRLGSLADPSREQRFREMAMTRFSSWVFAALLWLVVSPHLCQAQPELSDLVPRAIQCGAKTAVTAVGKFPQWPVQVTSDRPGLEFQLLESGKLEIQATAAALPGVYLIRFRDPQGVSQAVPLVVDSIPSFVETEPNAALDEANALPRGPVNVSGVLEKSGDVDCFRIACQQGEKLYVRMRANPLFGTSMDGLVQVCDARGFVLDQNDDRHGVDPELVVEIPADGDYMVRTFAFPAAPNSTVRFAGGADYRYLLTISPGPVFRVPFPLSDQGSDDSQRILGSGGLEDGVVERHPVRADRVFVFSPGRPGFWELPQSPTGTRVLRESVVSPDESLAVPFDVSGVISSKRELDWLAVRLEKGQAVRFRAASRQFGLELDPQIGLFDATGKQLAVQDDVSKSEPDPVLDFSPPETGVYYLRLQDAANRGGPDYLYRITAEHRRPDVKVTVPESRFAAEVGQPLEIDVQIERLDGFDQPLEISLEGLPEEVEVKAVRSEPQGDSAKAVQLKVKSDVAFQVAARIVARSTEQTFVAEHLHPSGYPVREIWITVKPAKDQSSAGK